MIMAAGATGAADRDPIRKRNVRKLYYRAGMVEFVDSDLTGSRFPRTLPAFDCGALISALDAQRVDRGLGWTALADELWQQSSELNAKLADHSLCPGALVRLARRRASMSCQYALIILRWLRRAPEEFLCGPVMDVGDVRLPRPGSDRRLRWNLHQVHAALDERRRERELTWSELAGELACTPNRLTNLRTARLADMGLTMRVTQWLEQPAARFVHAAQW